jgi:hypothetical protein
VDEGGDDLFGWRRDLPPFSSGPNPKFSFEDDFMWLFSAPAKRSVRKYLQNIVNWDYKYIIEIPGEHFSIYIRDSIGLRSVDQTVKLKNNIDP